MTEQFYLQNSSLRGSKDTHNRVQTSSSVIKKFVIRSPTLQESFHLASIYNQTHAYKFRLEECMEQCYSMRKKTSSSNTSRMPGQKAEQWSLKSHTPQI